MSSPYGADFLPIEIEGGGIAAIVRNKANTKPTGATGFAIFTSLVRFTANIFPLTFIPIRPVVYNVDSREPLGRDR